jgi:membrane protease YdiL (CAAX protease family)
MSEMRKSFERAALPGLALTVGPAWILAVAALWHSMPGAGMRVATLLILAPLIEEILFRSGLQETLLRLGARRGVTGLANVATAVAFAFAHLILRPDLWAGLTVIPALACGALYEQRRRVAPCIALHALFNAVWLLAMPKLT